MVLVQGQLLRSPKVIRSTSCCQAMVRSTSCWLTLTATVPVLVGVRPRTSAPVCLCPQHQYHSLHTPWVPSTTIAPSTSLWTSRTTVTGTNWSSSGTHAANISVSVVSPSSPNFAINSIPTSLTVPQDSSGTISITLTSVNSFSGTITLSATVSPSGPQPSFNHSSVTLTSRCYASSPLTLSTAASTSGYYSTPTPVSQGNYSVNVTASSGSLSHSTPVSLTVGSTNSAPPGSSSLPLLPIAVGVIAVVAVFGTALFLRKRKH